MSAPRARLQVVIVSYKSRDLVGTCLESLRAYSPADCAMRVDVVDNASDDGTAELIRARFPEVGLHLLAVNRGFSYANNVVLRDLDVPYALLLNPDTVIKEGVLDRLLELIASDTSIGMVGPRLVRADGSFDHAAKRSFPTPLSALGHFTGIGRRRDVATLSAYRAPELGEHECGLVDAINGAFMLVRRDAIAEVGLLDEGFWLYMEDLDWCYRFQVRGWPVVYDGTTTVVHLKNATSGRHRRLRQNVAFHRGMGRFYRKHYAGDRPWLDAPVYGGIGLKLALSVVRSTLARRLAGARGLRAWASTLP